MFNKGDHISYARVTPKKKLIFCKLLDTLLIQRLTSLKGKDSSLGNDSSLNNSFSDFIKNLSE